MHILFGRRVYQIKHHSWPGASVILVANKVDMGSLRKVSASDGQRLSEDLGSVLTPVYLLYVWHGSVEVKNLFSERYIKIVTYQYRVNLTF